MKFTAHELHLSKGNGQCINSPFMHASAMVHSTIQALYQLSDISRADFMKKCGGDFVFEYPGDQAGPGGGYAGSLFIEYEEFDILPIEEDEFAFESAKLSTPPEQEIPNYVIRKYRRGRIVHMRPCGLLETLPWKMRVRYPIQNLLYAALNSDLMYLVDFKHE